MPSLASLRHEHGLGVSLAVGIGNGADVGVADTVAYLS